MNRRERFVICAISAGAGIVVSFLFAAIVHAWGAKTLAWPGFRPVLILMYPFATVPAKPSLYPLFLLTAAFNACYYGFVALIGTFLRDRGASAVVVALVVLLIAIVAASVLQLGFEALARPAFVTG